MIDIKQLHDAMQNAPHDNENYRMTRAAVDFIFQEFLKKDKPTDEELLGCAFVEW
jgi:hypothetical protein